MIIVDIKGNLGNQMFIYACARKLQEQTGQRIQLNTYYLGKRYKNYKYELDIFRLNENVEVCNKRNIPFYASSSSFFYRVLKKITKDSNTFKSVYYRFFSHFNVFVNESDIYTEIKPKTDRTIYLSGFFQSPLYFDDIKQELKHEFVTKKGISKKNIMFLKKIKEKNGVCVSVRRGDYISNDIFRKKHFVCDDSYFKKAISTILSLIPNATLVFFSDDPEWVKRNYGYDNAIYELPGNSLEDKISLMIACKHFILSNSSFSWWVEYLSASDEKKVVAPSKWYVDGRATSIYQKYWNLIEV